MRLLHLLFVLHLAAAIAACGPAARISPDSMKPQRDRYPERRYSSRPLLPDEPPPPGASDEFRTDFSDHTVPYAEIISGGPSKDDIPAIDTPRFVSTADADLWLRPNEPVILVSVEKDVRAYPIRIIIWHELVNDVIGGKPMLISYCPLCNTPIAFSRRFEDSILSFGTTGYLRYGNLIMYDRQTESWWQQAEGESIAGAHTGLLLESWPTRLVPWSHVRDEYPDAKILSGSTGHTRDYGRNPYAGYDDIARAPFLYRGPKTPAALPPMEHVLGITLGKESKAYPFSVLAREHVVNDSVGGVPVVIFWQPGMTSGLKEAEVAAGDDLGSAMAFTPSVDGRTLRFQYRDSTITDDLTGRAWNGYGISLSRPIPGMHLSPITSANAFWFTWAAFNPKTGIYTGR